MVKKTDSNKARLNRHKRVRGKISKSLGATAAETLRACAEPLQSCLVICTPTRWGPPGASIHGLLQARTLQ